MTTMEDRSEKYHYAILKDGEEAIVYWFKGLKYPYSRGYCHQIYQYLAPVPSYEQWQLMQDDNKRLKHDVGNLGYKIKNQRHEIDNRLKEIEKLKELLKESKEYVENFIEGSTVINDHHISYILLQRINEVLK